MTYHLSTLSSSPGPGSNPFGSGAHLQAAQPKGYELARAVRRDARLAHLRLVALTGYGRSEDEANAVAAGFDHHLVKPVDLDALEALVVRWNAAGESRSSRGTSTLH